VCLVGMMEDRVQLVGLLEPPVQEDVVDVGVEPSVSKEVIYSQG
jgi:hypothetical protein